MAIPFHERKSYNRMRQARPKPGQTYEYISFRITKELKDKIDVAAGAMSMSAFLAALVEECLADEGGEK